MWHLCLQNAAGKELLLGSFVKSVIHKRWRGGYFTRYCLIRDVKKSRADLPAVGVLMCMRFYHVRRLAFPHKKIPHMAVGYCRKVIRKLSSRDRTQEGGSGNVRASDVLRALKVQSTAYEKTPEVG